MKNNCLFIFDRPSAKHAETLTILDGFFRELSSTHYVYVAEPDRDEIEDSPGGARHLRWNESLIESFGNLSTIVVADNNELYTDLKSKVSPATQVISLNLSDDTKHPIRRLTEHFLASGLKSRPPLSRKAA